MKSKIFVILSLLVSELIAFIRFKSCWIFSDSFYFTFSNLQTRITLAVNPENTLPLIFVRALHNKITEFISGYLLTFLQYIDTRFLMEFIGVAGTIGVYLGFWYMLTTKKNKFIKIILSILLIMAVSTEMVFNLHFKFFYKILVIVLIFYAFSLYGWWNRINVKFTKTNFMFFLIILIFSVLAILLFPNSHYLVCFKA
jgi:hypothetical protein